MPGHRLQSPGVNPSKVRHGFTSLSWCALIAFLSNVGLWASMDQGSPAVCSFGLNMRIGTPDTPLVARRSDRIRKQMVERVKDGKNIVVIVLQMIYYQRVQLTHRHHHFPFFVSAGEAITTPRGSSIHALLPKHLELFAPASPRRVEMDQLKRRLQFKTGSRNSIMLTDVYKTIERREKMKEYQEYQRGKRNSAQFKSRGCKRQYYDMSRSHPRYSRVEGQREIDNIVRSHLSVFACHLQDSRGQCLDSNQRRRGTQSPVCCSSKLATKAIESNYKRHYRPTAHRVTTRID